jgi:hypothetical protein
MAAFNGFIAEFHDFEGELQGPIPDIDWFSRSRK